MINALLLVVCSWICLAGCKNLLATLKAPSLRTFWVLLLFFCTEDIAEVLIHKIISELILL